MGLEPIMDEFELRKNIGKLRESPFRNITWKEYVHHHNVKYRKNSKKHIKVVKRRNRQMAIQEKDPNKTKSLMKQEPYRWEIYGQANTPLKMAKLRRSNRYCSQCGYLFCEHRARESALWILHSRKEWDGDFAVFPKEIALIIANLVYGVQLDFVQEIRALPQGIPFDFCHGLSDPNCYRYVDTCR